MRKNTTDLTLLLLYLTGWEEDSRAEPGEKIVRSWKEPPFEVLNELEEAGLVRLYRGTKSLVIPHEGIRKAQKIKEAVFAAMEGLK